MLAEYYEPRGNYDLAYHSTIDNCVSGDLGRMHSSYQWPRPLIGSRLLYAKGSEGSEVGHGMVATLNGANPA
jgi:hypothetical protein